MKPAGVRIAGLGHAVPHRVVTNAELETQLGLDPGWIFRRTGIQNRRWAGTDETLSGLAAQAARPAIADVDLAQIGLLLLATSTPDQLLPPSAPRVAHLLGLPHAGASDLAGACAGFINAMALAEAYVRAHGRMALVIGANILSRRINPQDRGSAILFADAAGAVLLAPSDNPAQGVLGLDLTSDGSQPDLVQVPRGAAHMEITDGRALFAGAVHLMASCAARALDAAQIPASAITRAIPHQANARIFDLVCDRLHLPPDTVQRSIQDYGNSSAATIPLTLSLSAAASPLRAGERILMMAAGAGLIGGALVFGQ